MERLTLNKISKLILEFNNGSKVCVDGLYYQKNINPISFKNQIKTNLNRKKNESIL